MIITILNTCPLDVAPSCKSLKFKPHLKTAKEKHDKSGFADFLILVPSGG